MFGRRRGRLWIALGVTAAVVAGGATVEVRRSGGLLARQPAPSPTAPLAPPAAGRADPRGTPTPLPPLGRPPVGNAVLPTRAGVARALDVAFADRRLGPRVSAVVTDAETGQVLYSRNSALSVQPASTAKVVTALAALHVLGPDRRLETTVVPDGSIVGGRLTGRLVLVGGGDTTLASPAGAARIRYPEVGQVEELAREVRALGITEVTGGVVVDSTLFVGPRTAPGWKPNYLTEGSVAPVTSLMVDGARVELGESERYAEPDLAAGRVFRDLLRRQGIRLPDPVGRATAPAGVEPVARVSSPTVAALVERMLAVSDNNLAESLAHLVAKERGEPASFAGGARAMAAALADLGLPGDGSGLVDGSGLSPHDRMTTAALARVLAVALDPGRPALRALVSGLPVGGFGGTLEERYDEGAATTGAGRVRAKTGSLNNVSTLAGVVETASGRQLVFAFSADRLPTRLANPAAEVLDTAAAALARCGCAA
ncbi:MAG TPA: D-alanyl-D-alanine carboxypeptidase/D-alanyl-D-alanine-endopeptidase [Mycobacteriales bacterium]|nr:D-alanyl-D-alanine carboxypeptidase/D-alanyl-D-alanine-endopeptidase [Mycobacteriales bacterium]